MKDYVLELVSTQEGYNAKLNLMREYLQAYILRVLYEEKFFQQAVFLGGTALRFMYNLPRFSQDLDFSLLWKKKVALVDKLKKLQKELELSGYKVNIIHKKKKAVHSAMIKFKGLMYEVGLSPHPEEKLSIKLEIDTNPPAGAHTEPKIVNKYFLISFLTYDLPTLFAGKIHALLSRRYSKGRDFFDLLWYLSKWSNLAPNIIFLRNALKQTGWHKEYPTLNNWREYLSRRIEKADWEKITKDIESFLENPADLAILNKKSLLNLIKSGY